MGNLNFDIDTAPEETEGFEPLPEGHYRAEIIDSDVKSNKKGTGRILKLTFNILSGEYSRDYVGRKIFENLNIENESVKAMRIARSQLKSLCRALGKDGIVENSQELHNQPVDIEVVIAPAFGDYGPSNKISNYYAAAKVVTKTIRVEDDNIPF